MWEIGDRNKIKGKCVDLRVKLGLKLFFIIIDCFCGVICFLVVFRRLGVGIDD